MFVMCKKILTDIHVRAVEREISFPPVNLFEVFYVLLNDVLGGSSNINAPSPSTVAFKKKKKLT